MAKVTKDTMIGELLQIDENVAPMLLNIGMHCLGCPSSQMETIAEAAMVHGLDVDVLVNQINDFLGESTISSSMMQPHRFHVSKRSAEFQHSFLI